MKGQRPVFWSQGLFLHPQHFQAMDAQTHDHIDVLRVYGLPHFWGIRRIVFAGTDNTHSLALERLEAIFPSGAIVNVPFDTHLPPIALDSDWPLPDKTGILYVGLALNKASGQNATLQSDAINSRYKYTENPDALPDMYSNAAPTPVQHLSYAPILIRDIDLNLYTNYECLPIALFNRVGESVERTINFLPPLISIDGHPYFMQLLQEVCDTALSCASRLIGYKSNVAADNPDMRFMLNFTALNILNRHIPYLAHLRAQTNTHPWHVYGQLRVLAGELSSFYGDMDCLGRTTGQSEGIPEYNHEKLNSCFPAICGLITRLINNLGIENSKIIELLPDSPYFTAQIPDDFILSNGKYWLNVTSNEMSENLAEHLPFLAKVGAKDRLHVITAKAVSGVQLTNSPPPPGFIKNPKVAWYRIETSNALWKNIIDQSTISIFWEGAPEDTVIKFVATGQ